ncbi:hypothetical protein GGX14DRAFT_402512 [Mycena pura]|uniref:Uncharacterized protein n=1 Tax=Mycena pura TaxID=153505 RepID=A0AAD6Y9C9_9AGAR|nr:hypothetical protein GGX14DRAFT_402512 [Mycena pura]
MHSKAIIFIALPVQGIATNPTATNLHSHSPILTSGAHAGLIPIPPPSLSPTRAQAAGRMSAQASGSQKSARNCAGTVGFVHAGAAAKGHGEHARACAPELLQPRSTVIALAMGADGSAMRIKQWANNIPGHMHSWERQGNQSPSAARNNFPRRQDTHIGRATRMGGRAGAAERQSAAAGGAIKQTGGRKRRPGEEAGGGDGGVDRKDMSKESGTSTKHTLPSLLIFICLATYLSMNSQMGRVLQRAHAGTGQQHYIPVKTLRAQGTFRKESRRVERAHAASAEAQWRRKGAHSSLRNERADAVRLYKPHDDAELLRSPAWMAEHGDVRGNGMTDLVLDSEHLALLRVVYTATIQTGKESVQDTRRYTGRYIPLVADAGDVGGDGNPRISACSILSI